MKQFIIGTDGAINLKASSANPDQLYGQYDDATFSLHFSETEATTKAQITAIKDLLEKATGDKKAPKRVKQRATNAIGFSLANESDSAVVKQAKNDAFQAIVKEAGDINQKLKANPQGGAQQQTPPPKGGAQQQTPPPKGGAQQQTPPPKGGAQQQTGSQQGGQQQSGAQQQTFDKSKDAFGRPLKQAYPGLFYPGMTPQEEEAEYDKYWAMVQHVDKDIFHKT